MNLYYNNKKIEELLRQHPLLSQLLWKLLHLDRGNVMFTAVK